MRLPRFLEGVPRYALLLPVPGVAFLIALGVALATTDGGGGSRDHAVVAPTISLQNLDTPPTPAPTVATAASPSPTAAVNRQDCNRIRGTDYLSGEERDWYLANCLGGGQAAAPGSSGAPPAAAGGPPTGGGAVAAGEFALGDRLVIPSIGVNAVVTGVRVPASGAMPDPKGYFNAVWYDFAEHPGLGGYTDGNLTLAGHVDCARCHNGASGTAVFYSVRSLKPGDTIQYVTSRGETVTYTVFLSQSYDPNINWAPIVAQGAADLTIITCTGTFSGGHYNLRHVVQARKS